LLLNQFGYLENILNNAESIEKPSIKESIAKNAERLHNNYKFIKLDDRADLPFALDSLCYNYNNISTNDVLKGII